MAYAPVTDLLTRIDAGMIAERTDRSVAHRVTGAILTTAAMGGDLSQLDQDVQVAAASALMVAQQAMDDADELIDGYLSSRFALPIVNPPRFLVRLACDCAWFFLFDGRSNQEAQERYNHALKTLREIAAGRISLGRDPAGGEVKSADMVRIEGDLPVFRRNRRTGGLSW